jgi:5-methylcytosine-specific restriction enzyme A
MEKIVSEIVFRSLTHADFFNINKTGGEEVGGGGQSYIDFPTANVTVSDWRRFLGTPTATATQGPEWRFLIRSLGLTAPQNLKIYQRRPQSVSIAAQKIHSNRANRVQAWHPNHGFPATFNPGANRLVVYIIKSTDQEYWAGWFLRGAIPDHWFRNTSLLRMFQEDAGIIRFTSTSRVFFNTTDTEWAFYFNAVDPINKIVTEEAIEEDLVNEDVSPRLANIDNSPLPAAVKERIIRTRRRNKAVVNNLKALYGNRCQLTGTALTFTKTNGDLYSEVHHLIPLGEDGSDSYANAIVVSPLVHRMLHYATVSPINLSQIVDNTLAITINGQPYTITWHQNHMNVVQQTIEA